VVGFFFLVIKFLSSGNIDDLFVLSVNIFDLLNFSNDGLSSFIRIVRDSDSTEGVDSFDDVFLFVDSQHHGSVDHGGVS